MILWCFVFSGVSWGQKVVEEIIARVNNEIILKSEHERAKKQLYDEVAQQLSGAELERIFNERVKNLLRDLIDQSLLLQKAKELGMTADLEVVKTMERMRREFKFDSLEALEKAIVQQGGNVEDFKQGIRTRYLTQQVIGREVYPRIVITTEDLRKFYEENKKEFDRPEGIRIREIVISTENKTPDEIRQAEQTAKGLLERVQKGDEFEEIAQQNSEAPTAQNGGDLGFFEKGTMAKELEDAAYQLERNQVSDVLKMPYGFVILKVEDKHSGGILPFELATNEIQNRLWNQRVQPKVREYLTKLRVEGFVDVRPGYADTGAVPKQTKASEAK